MSYPIDAYAAGKSDKYGQVYVEKCGREFDDRDEPVAVLRAEDIYSVIAMKLYLRSLSCDVAVSDEKLASVRRQISAMEEWQKENPEKVRAPGSKRD